MHHRGGQQAWSPPPNFAMVETGVYRSAYPTLASVPYLKHIGVKTIVLLSIEHLPGPVARALSSTTHHAAHTRGAAAGGAAKKGEESTACPIRVVCTADLGEWMNEFSFSRDDFAESGVRRALDFALQTDFQPVLFACPTGDIQTSVVVGCMRRYQGWTLAAALGECELFVNISRHVRSSVMRFIERWDLNEQPLQEISIASRKRELLLQECQDEGFKGGQRGGVQLNSSMETDSENDDSSAVKNSNKIHGEEDHESHSIHDEKNASGKKNWYTVKSKENGIVSSCSSVSIVLAPWYTSSIARRAAYAAELLSVRRVRASYSKENRLRDPHERYFGVLNPPSLDERSTFTKDSIVEEDDD